VTQSEELQIELPVNIDAGEPFVKATYSLKGDGHLTLRCYEILDDVSHLPNRALIVKKNCHFIQNWMDYATSCANQALTTVKACLMVISLSFPLLMRLRVPNFSILESLDLNPDAKTINTFSIPIYLQ